MDIQSLAHFVLEKGNYYRHLPQQLQYSRLSCVRKKDFQIFFQYWLCFFFYVATSSCRNSQPLLSTTPSHCVLSSSQMIKAITAVSQAVASTSRTSRNKSHRGYDFSHYSSSSISYNIWNFSGFKRNCSSANSITIIISKLSFHKCSLSEFISDNSYWICQWKSIEYKQ